MQKGAEYLLAAPFDAMLQGPLQFCCLILCSNQGSKENGKKMYPRRPVQSSSGMGMSCTKQRWKLVIEFGMQTGLCEVCPYY